MFLEESVAGNAYFGLPSFAFCLRCGSRCLGAADIHHATSYPTLGENKLLEKLAGPWTITLARIRLLIQQEQLDQN